MRILETGSYISVAYAGMILAEQGHQVTKWVSPTRQDPIQGLRKGDDLWAWINHGKHVETRHASDISSIDTGELDGIIDNIRAVTWRAWNVDPVWEAERLGVVWVSMRDDFDGRSFDAIAQARAWGDHLGYLPAYLGDTTAGLWTAFKLLAAGPGHHVLRQGACLTKLIEGELAVLADRSGDTPPWDEPGTYGADGDGTHVAYRGDTVREPYRDDAWRLQNLAHQAGRLII